MSQLIRRAVALAALATAAACTDQPTPLESPVHPTAPAAPAAAAPAGSAAQARHERFARRLALTLRDAEFRTEVLAAVQQSRVREGKVHLQRFLQAPQSGRLKRMAVQSGESEANLGSDLAAAEPIELYLPVPAHRQAWRGGADVLVATAETDRDPPVAFDLSGSRRLLDPERPPLTPVLAVGRAEVDFESSGPQATIVPDQDIDTTASGETVTTVTASPGLYMTYSRITSSFEGWLKGAPEYEVHILGQDGSTGAMKSYQCAGESAGTPYQYNQDDTEWRGSVLLFSQAQLDAYKAEHPGQALRILLIEDDDTRCVIKTDSARVARMFNQIASSFGTLTGGRDTVVAVRTYRRATTLFNILKAVWSAIQSQDDVIGTAIEDIVAGQYYPGANWIIKGESTVTFGALKLEMR